MGVMWDYFKDTLRWPLIRLKQGALAMMAEGGGNAQDDAREAIIWLRQQFLPATAEGDYLPAFAASRSITRHPSETDAQYRERVVRAWYWHYLGGKQAGLPKILELYGYGEATIRNWREVDPALWAEFWVDLLPQEHGQTVTDADLAVLLWAINNFKPARSKLRGLGVKRAVSGPVRLAAASRVGARITLRPRLPIAARVHAPMRIGVVTSCTVKIRLLPRGA